MNRNIILLFLISLCVSLAGSCRNNIKEPQTIQAHDAYVIGIISSIEPVVIPNKAKGKPSRTETRITIAPTQAFDAHGNEIRTGNSDDPVFAGDADLIHQFKTGEKVKIVCTSVTGRHIKTIEKAQKVNAIQITV